MLTEAAISSAWGHHAVEPKAVTVMAELGIDISHEYSKPVRPEDVAWADAIVALEEEHASFLLENFPEAAGKIHLLSEKVRDPVSHPLSVACIGSAVFNLRGCSWICPYGKPLRRNEFQELMAVAPIFTPRAA